MGVIVAAHDPSDPYDGPPPQLRWGGRSECAQGPMTSVNCLDPDGNLIEIASYPSESD